MLEARDLVKRYAGIPAVEGVSFTIAAGQVLGYLGPNGAGKSTTVKMLTGLVQPGSGAILFNGHNIHYDLAAYKRHVGYVPEEPHLYPYLSGYEYLEMVGTLRGIRRRELARKADGLLELFGLREARHAAMSSYSKGMRQKVLLTSALLANPELLILDEPLSGLDVTSAVVVRQLVGELAKRGKAVFFCSHILEVVEKVCSHLVVLRKGRMVAYGTLEDVRRESDQESLEGTFSHLTEERDASKIADSLAELVVA